MIQAASAATAAVSVHCAAPHSTRLVNAWRNAPVVAFGMRGVLTIVGSPAPGTITVQVPGGPVSTVDADGRFQFAAVPATATTLTLRADGRESVVRFPMSPLTGPQLQLDLRFDVATGVVVVDRLCATSTSDPGAPGTASIVSMCVSGG